MNVRGWFSRLWSSRQRRRAMRRQARIELTDAEGRDELERARKGIRNVPPAGF